MSKATAAITDQFKNTYVKTSGIDTTDIQRALFQMGFYFGEATKGSKREVFRPLAWSYLRVDENGVIWRSEYLSDPLTVVNGCKRVNVFEIYDAAEAVRKIKREEGKASKKRRALRKWEAEATKHYGTACPVSPDTVVAIKMRDGEVWTERADNIAWGECGDGTVVSYKVLPQRPNKPYTVTQDEMFTGIAASLGKGVAKVAVDSDGWTPWDSGPDFKWQREFAGWYGPAEPGAIIDIKFRSGKVEEGVENGKGSARGAFWFTEGDRNDIVAWRVSTPKRNIFDELMEGVDAMKATWVTTEDITSVSSGFDRERLDQIYDALGTSEAIREPVAAVGDVNSEVRGSGARFNAGKPDFSLIPMKLLEGEARVWAYGAKKYKAWNWMKGMDWNVPFACAMRHMAAWQAGEDTDPETGESHLDHAMCNLRMLRYYTDFYKEGDNRPKEFFDVKGEE